MYAIVEIAGQQFKVEKGRTIYTHRLEGDADAVLASDKVKVLLVDNDGAISIGAPAVEGASVSVKIVEHLKGEKVLVFKKKRRKGYKKKNGHRQYLTKVLIEDITV
ncbi:MAG: 50S ribosomal protein L21 [Bacteroidetes bacterium]|nr:50S ribosomal protein L21 [Fibrella sp.]